MNRDQASGSWLKRNLAGHRNAAQPAPAAPPPDPGEDAAVAALLGRLEALQNVLLKNVADARGVHAETVLMAVGALAGRAALEAALTRAAVATRQDGHVPPDALLLVGAESGETFVLGALVSEHLYGDGDTLARRAAGAVQALGLASSDLPEPASLAAATARALGTPEFGRLDVPDAHAPRLHPREAIEQLWPEIKAVLCDAPSSPAQAMLVDPRTGHANWGSSQHG